MTCKSYKIRRKNNKNAKAASPRKKNRRIRKRNTIISSKKSKSIYKNMAKNQKYFQAQKVKKF